VATVDVPTEILFQVQMQVVDSTTHVVSTCVVDVDRADTMEYVIATTRTVWGSGDQCYVEPTVRDVYDGRVGFCLLVMACVLLVVGGVGVGCRKCGKCIRVKVLPGVQEGMEGVEVVPSSFVV
jgi:hypothetical protein